jgi:hypothetical protein
MMLFYIVQKSSVIKVACFRGSVDISTCYIKKLLGYITLHLRFSNFGRLPYCCFLIYEIGKFIDRNWCGVSDKFKSGWCSFGLLSPCGGWVDQNLFDGHGEGKEI